jgi:hypothetical protein
MNTSHAAPIALRSSLHPLLDAISHSLRVVIDHFRDRRQAVQYDDIVAKLPPRLRFDIGELDCMPPPASIPRTRYAYPEVLEAQWQRGI